MMEKKKGFSGGLAKGIRVLSVPPVMAAVVLVELWVYAPQLFSAPRDAWLAFVFLGAVPLLAYPVSWLVPALRRRGREAQRELAFYFTFAGYVAGVLFGIFFSRSAGLTALFLTYLCSVLLLTVLNRALHIKASGHATSATAPLGVACLFSGLWSAVCGLVYGAILWASVREKRHTVPEFFLGSLTCLVSALLVWGPYLLYRK